ncbi:MAG TPA: V-type ATP synthase subunit F [Spirochaetota bacterium]
MEFFCIGEQEMCELFSLVGIRYATCGNATDAARIISGRKANAEIIIVSETLVAQNGGILDPLMDDPTRIIIPVPSPSSGKSQADTRSLLRHLMGGL